MCLRVFLTLACSTFSAVAAFFYSYCSFLETVLLFHRLTNKSLYVNTGVLNRKIWPQTSRYKWNWYHRNIDTIESSIPLNTDFTKTWKPVKHQYPEESIQPKHRYHWNMNTKETDITELSIHSNIGGNAVGGLV